MNLFVLWDNSSRPTNNQINPTCAQSFSINRGGLQVISTHLGSLPLSTCLWVLVGGEILGDNATLIQKAGKTGTAEKARKAGTIRKVGKVEIVEKVGKAGTVGNVGTTGKVGEVGKAETVGTVGTAGTAKNSWNCRNCREQPELSRRQHGAAMAHNVVQ